jgi:hypothetical protein
VLESGVTILYLTLGQSQQKLYEALFWLVGPPFSKRLRPLKRLS